jgi:F-type H+-transporting ATPase subunit b
VSYLLQYWIHWSQVNVVIPNPYELPFGAICFLAVFVLARRLLPRVTQTIAARTEAIDGRLLAAEHVNAEAAQALEQHRAILAEARHDAAQLRREAAAHGARYVAAQREDAQLAARLLADAARSRLTAEYEDAYAALRPDAGELAVDLASRIVGEPLRQGSGR